MNFTEKQLGPAPAAKVSWTEPNVANQIADHLRRVIPEAFQVPGVWVTGSNVWRFVYGDMPDPDADIDIICERAEERSPRLEMRDLLKIKDEAPTAPSAAERSDLNGRKYLLEDGRTVDIWAPPIAEIEHTRIENLGLEGILYLLRQYPEHSHAHARCAYSPTLGILVVLPNTAAPTKP